MNVEQAKAAIELIEQAAQGIDERAWSVAERHADAMDRHISQIGQLKLLNEYDPLNGLVEALAQGAAAAANPT